jgi:hypothetical protein
LAAGFFGTGSGLLRFRDASLSSVAGAATFFAFGAAVTFGARFARGLAGGFSSSDAGKSKTSVSVGFGFGARVGGSFATGTDFWVFAGARLLTVRAAGFDARAAGASSSDPGRSKTSLAGCAFRDAGFPFDTCLAVPFPHARVAGMFVCLVR